MPSYRCTSCREITDDVDMPRCTEKCKGTNFARIVQIHLAYVEDKVQKLFCLGEEARSNVRATSTPYGCTCRECLDAYVAKSKKDIEEKQNAISEPEPEPELETEVEVELETEKPSSLPEGDGEDPETKTLQESDFPPRIITSIKAFIEKSNDPDLEKLNTVVGLREWILAGNDLSNAVSGIGDTSERTVLQLLGLER